MYNEVDLNDFILGACIDDLSAVKRLGVSQYLLPNYRALYEQLEVLESKGITGYVDIVSQDQFDPDVITSLYEGACIASNLPLYARELKKIHALKETNKVLQRAGQMSDLVEQKQFLESSLKKIDIPQEDRSSLLLGDQLDGWEEAFNQKWEGLIKPEIVTGFKILDEQNLLNLTDLTVLAAQPGMGKTTFALDAAIEAAKNGTSVLFVSLEMSKHQVISKITSYLARVPIFKITDPYRYSPTTAEYERIIEAQEEMRQLPFAIVDSGDKLSKWGALTGYINEFADNYNCKLVVIDYLLLIQPDDYSKNQTRAHQVGEMTRGLKALAQELNVCILVLTQLNRSVNQSADKMPELYHLKESSSIEADANNVIFIHRPEVFDDNPDNRDVAIVKIAKARMGELKQKHLVFKGKYSYFKEL